MLRGYPTAWSRNAVGPDQSVAITAGITCKICIVYCLFPYMRSNTLTDQLYLQGHVAKEALSAWRQLLEPVCSDCGASIIHPKQAGSCMTDVGVK